MLVLGAPEVERKIMPSLTLEQVNYLIEVVECIRDNVIISFYTTTQTKTKHSLYPFRAEVQVGDICPDLLDNKKASY